MTDTENKIDFHTYKKEVDDVLQKLVKSMPAYEELQYFEKCVRSHSLTDIERNHSALVVIGSNIPEELVLISGKMPCWILGGSRASSMWADDMVPRDTDPVSRSGLGYVLSGFDQNSLILIPLVSDSTRKLAYILKSRGYKVHTCHFPPVKDAQSYLEWRRQYEACRDAIALHLKRPMTNRTLRKSQAQILTAKRQIQTFQDVSQDKLSGVIRMFVQGSYYCAEDLSEWCSRLRSLTERLQREPKLQTDGRSNVLLLGSPIYFPNYKVPFLIEEAGLTLCGQIDYTTLSMQEYSGKEYRQRENAADIFYENDASPAYVKNDALYECVTKLLTKKEIDGVVYHVLKGQIEYDFELERYEKLFEKLDIPIFRLETDYNYQDIEQLRVRMEAFSEILNQRRYRKERVTI